MPIVLKNATCPYCGVALHRQNRAKEHVIGRRFVPKGKLAGEWNLILYACKKCNGEKADLEDDISAITMQPDAWGEHAVDDPVLIAEAGRKGASSKSRRTRKPVKESTEQLSVDMPFGPSVKMTFGLHSAPQIDPHRAFRLAQLQTQGFFYWLTFNKASGKGGYWPGSFFPVSTSVRSDWGNATDRAFMNAVLDWEVRLLGVAAKGFFKVAIRRHPNAICWSWAYEWNHSLRVIGYFGDQGEAQILVDALLEAAWKVIPQGQNEILRYREEVRLADTDDKLFAQPSTQASS
ncbi:MAG TPA: hypothetical protein VGW57_07605 [Chthoniobacterales bacterium]|nr:hypothetical protein [Chthoniobacterales bacterium]